MASLSPEQVQIIKATVPILREHGKAITTHFYATMLREHPDLNDVFNQANQANNHQASALASALYAYASHIDDLGALSPAVEKICHKHASLYIRPDQYKVVGEYLLEAMVDVLGAALTPEVLEAWTIAYWQLANILIGREEQLYQQAEGWTDWRDFRIARKERESENIMSFYLQPVDGNKLPSFLPGQYISVMTDVPKLQHLQSRQYSLSDAPNEQHYRVSVKKEAGLDTSEPDQVRHPGYISNVLHEEKHVGDVLKVSHPYGEFFSDPARVDAKPVVLLSAGVGITPMISITNTLVRQDAEQPVSFIHGSKSSATRAFHKHLERVEAQCPNVKYTSFVKDPNTAENGGCTDNAFSGRLSLDKLDDREHLFLHDRGTQYFVCGPEGFMSDIESRLMSKGVEQGRIHMEVFGTGMRVQG